MTPLRASANVLPMVGWPAIGSSAPGVKMRIRTSVSGRSGGSTNVVSEKFISLAIACIVLGRQAAAVEKDRQLVAAEHAIGEDVVVQITIRSHLRRASGFSGPRPSRPKANQESQ